MDRETMLAILTTRPMSPRELDDAIRSHLYPDGVHRAGEEAELEASVLRVLRDWTRGLTPASIAMLAQLDPLRGEDRRDYIPLSEEDVRTAMDMMPDRVARIPGTDLWRSRDSWARRMEAEGMSIKAQASFHTYRVVREGEEGSP